MSSAKTIISLALSYAASNNLIKKCRNKEDSYISLYARGQDYHNVMKQKIKLLIEYIKKIKQNSKTIFYCDNGNLLEREIAYRAGLGWIGKNNSLINPVYGSYLFLGEILTNIDLNIDKPIREQCGNCNLCLKNCAGNAFIEPYHLDSEKCISYLTQKKGFIPENERVKIGTNLWGCDICLQVCPFNYNIPVDLHPEFKPVIKGDIIKILNFNKKNINNIWLNSAMTWRGLRILKRNAIINIGNIGNIDNNKYIHLLKKTINNPSPIIRGYSAWALGKIDNENYYNILSQRLNIEENKDVIFEIKKAIDIIKG